MSYGVEVFTGKGTERFSTESPVSKVPPKLLFSFELLSFRGSNPEWQGIDYVFDIGTPVNRVKFIFLTVSNFNFGKSGTWRIPVIVAKVNDTSSGNSLSVNVKASNIHWTTSGIDCLLWVLGE